MEILEYKNGKTRSQTHFGLQRLGLTFWRGEKSKEMREEEEEEGVGEEEDQGMFVLESSVFWILKVWYEIPWRFVPPLSRVLEEVTQTLHFC